MTQLDLRTDSPFESIRRVDDRGEHWSGRDLAPLMGYDQWRNFASAVDRAQVACANSGNDPNRHFAGVSKVAASGPAALDFRLTRYAAYLVAMNGDPRKPEVAAAQTYFAVKTREAEVRQNYPVPASFAEALELAAKQAREIESKTAALAVAAPKAEYVDHFVKGDEAALLRVVAAQLGVGERVLRDYLIHHKVIYRRPLGSRWSESKQRLVTEYSYHPYAERKAWFRTGDQPEAPRGHNGQMKTTLYVTPVGKVGIQNLLARHPIGGAK